MVEREIMELSELKYPNMRTELLYHLNWIKNSKNSTDENDLDEAIHFLFDDTSLSREPQKAVGYFLLNAKECSPISRLISEIDYCIEKIR